MAELASLAHGIETALRRRAAEIRWLERAAAILEETAQLTPHLPRGTATNKSIEIEIEGRMVPVSTRQAVVLRLLSEAQDGEIVPYAALYAIYGGVRGNLTVAIIKLREALKRHQVTAEIVNFKGENGYRLQIPERSADAA